LRDKHGQKKTT